MPFRASWLSGYLVFGGIGTKGYRGEGKVGLGGREDWNSVDMCTNFSELLRTIAKVSKKKHTARSMHTTVIIIQVNNILPGLPIYLILPDLLLSARYHLPELMNLQNPPYVAIRIEHGLPNLS
jgi:hypothetical protein